MKKIYSKPLISVEELSLDQSIATAVNCTASKADMQSLIRLGWFQAGYNCDKHIIFGENGQGGYYDINKDNLPDFEDDYHDTVCYHSNITTAFLS